MVTRRMTGVHERRVVGSIGMGGEGLRRVGDGAGGGRVERMGAIWENVLDCVQASTLAWSCAKDRWGIGMGGEGLRRVGGGAGGGPEGRMGGKLGDCARLRAV